MIVTRETLSSFVYPVLGSKGKKIEMKSFIYCWQIVYPWVDLFWASQNRDQKFIRTQENNEAAGGQLT